ncbi:unnamed protein product, partial [Nesidiocoris tenuis]
MKYSQNRRKHSVKNNPLDNSGRKFSKYYNFTANPSIAEERVFHAVSVACDQRPGEGVSKHFLRT